jgi:hypothetical protein
MPGYDRVFSRDPMVIPTSVSLLDRLKAARSDDPDWNRFVGMYLPLIRRWMGRIPGLGHEVDDVSQEVFLFLVRERSPDSTGVGRASFAPGCAR